MTGRTVISFLFGHFWTAIPILCLIGQACFLPMWLKAFDSARAKRIVKIAFLVLNLGFWAVWIRLYRTGPMDGPLWIWLGRPAISWQLVCFLSLFPALALGVVYLAVRFAAWLAWGRKPRRPLPSGVIDVTPPEPASVSRRLFLKRAGGACLAATAALPAWGLVRQGLSPGVSRKTLAFPALPDGLDGFKICQISDIHLGMWSVQEELFRTFRTAAELEPDLVVLTGDLVDDEPENARLYQAPLELLGGVPHGVHAILGNHDHYTGAARVAAILSESLDMMVDKRVVLPGAPMTLVGLDDRGMGSWLGRRSQDPDPDLLDFRKVLGPPRPGDFTVLLNHRPEGYRQASREGFDLYLAGHTHGGQYQLPGLSQLNLAAVFYRYSSGLYHEHPTWLNVSRGVGSVGLPFRLFAWNEIDLITLRKG